MTSTEDFIEHITQFYYSYSDDDYESKKEWIQHMIDLETGEYKKSSLEISYCHMCAMLNVPHKEAEALVHKLDWKVIYQTIDSLAEDFLSHDVECLFRLNM